MFVVKPGGLWLCGDFRALNKLIVRNRYPLPRIDKTIDWLVNGKYYSTLDLKFGYHQICIAEGDVDQHLLWAIRVHRLAFRTVQHPRHILQPDESGVSRPTRHLLCRLLGCNTWLMWRRWSFAFGKQTLLEPL